MHHQRSSFRAVVVVWPAKSAQFQSSSVTVEKHSSKRPARVCRSQSVRRTRHWPVGLFARSSFLPSLQKRTFLRARDFVRHKYSSIMAANRRWKMTVKSFNLLAAEKLQEAIFHQTLCGAVLCERRWRRSLVLNPDRLKWLQDFFQTNWKVFLSCEMPSVSDKRTAVSQPARRCRVAFRWLLNHLVKKNVACLWFWSWKFENWDHVHKKHLWF